MRVEETVTYLEMTSPDQLVPARTPESPIDLEEVDQSSASLVRGVYERIGAPYGWSGWKRGPALLARSPPLDARGWWPAGTHGWYSTMQEYDGSRSGFSEYGYSQGYQVNVQLREGERLPSDVRLPPAPRS